MFGAWGVAVYRHRWTAIAMVLAAVGLGVLGRLSQPCRACGRWHRAGCGSAGSPPVSPTALGPLWTACR